MTVTLITYGGGDNEDSLCIPHEILLSHLVFRSSIITVVSSNLFLAIAKALSVASLQRVLINKFAKMEMILWRKL